jgi:2-keto-3-deoxy-6-phosphogluconate aldolase
MNRASSLSRILNGGIVAIVRAAEPQGLVEVVAALAEGGVDVS